MTDCPARDDEKWDAYPETVLEFYDEGRTRVDLRRPLTDAARRRLAALGLAGPFAVFTAENPCGENAEDSGSAAAADREEARNERRTAVLEAELQRRGVHFVPVDGVAPTGDYRERCVAVEVPRSEAVSLATSLDQLALFWFDGRDFWLLGAALDEEPRRLPDPAGGVLDQFPRAW